MRPHPRPRWSSRLLAAVCLVLGPVSGAAAQSVPTAPGATRSSAAWFGALVGDSVDGGLELGAVYEGGPADSAGLRPRDVIVRVDGRLLTGLGEFAAIVSRAPVGRKLALDVLRGGRLLKADVVLGRRQEFAARAAAIPGPPLRLDRPTDRRRDVAEAFGFHVVDLTADLRRHYGAPRDFGVLVTSVDEGRPAAKAGLHVGDLLLQVGDHRVRDRVSLAGALGSVEGGTSHVASLLRGHRALTLRISRAARPAPPQRVDPMRYATAPVARLNSGDRNRLERSIVEEIRRLEARIEQLRGELQNLKGDE